MPGGALLGKNKKKIHKGLLVQHGHGFSFHLAYLLHV